MQKAPYVFPIIGGRKVEHLMANIDALKITLSDEQVKYLESVIPFDLGFPHNIIVRCLLAHPMHWTWTDIVYLDRELELARQRP